MTTAFNVAIVTPLTGPLAVEGLAGLRAATLWARDERLPPPWDEVTLTAYDAHPDPAAAVRAATSTRPNALLGPYGRAGTIAVIEATNRVVFNHGGPTTHLVRQAYPFVVNLAAPASTWTRGVLDLVRASDRRVRRVALMVGVDEAALETVAITRAAAASRAFEVTVAGFRDGQAAAAARRLPPADVLIVDASPEDELAIAEILLERPWRAAAFSSAGAEQAFATIGPRRDSILGPRSWTAEIDTATTDGPTSAQFVAAYRTAHGSEPSEAAAAAYAAGVILGRCVQAGGGADDHALLAAARGIDTATLFGRFRLDPATGLQVGHRIRIAQWQKGRPRLVWPTQDAQSAARHPRWHPVTETA